LSFIEHSAEWLLLIVGIAVWLLLITSTVVSSRRQMDQLRTDVDELAQRVQAFAIAEDRRLIETMYGGSDSPLISMREDENRRSIAGALDHIVEVVRR
jgi:hypothetical protein